MELIVNICHLEAKINLSFLDHNTVIITARMSSIERIVDPGTAEPEITVGAELEDTTD